MMDCARIKLASSSIFARVGPRINSLMQNTKPFATVPGKKHFTMFSAALFAIQRRSPSPQIYLYKTVYGVCGGWVGGYWGLQERFGDQYFKALD
jgi:hypothetical protein